MVIIIIRCNVTAQKYKKRNNPDKKNEKKYFFSQTRHHSQTTATADAVKPHFLTYFKNNINKFGC